MTIHKMALSQLNFSFKFCRQIGGSLTVLLIGLVRAGAGFVLLLDLLVTDAVPFSTENKR